MPNSDAVAVGANLKDGGVEAHGVEQARQPGHGQLLQGFEAPRRELGQPPRQVLRPGKEAAAGGVEVGPGGRAGARGDAPLHLLEGRAEGQEAAEGAFELRERLVGGGGEAGVALRLVEKETREGVRGGVVEQGARSFWVECLAREDLADVLCSCVYVCKG